MDATQKRSGSGAGHQEDRATEATQAPEVVGMLEDRVAVPE
jgi:hypothetical protein